MHVMFYKNMRCNFFYGYNILTGGVFVTQLSGNAGISVRQIVGVMTNCRFMSKLIPFKVSVNTVILAKPQTDNI